MDDQNVTAWYMSCINTEVYPSNKTVVLDADVAQLWGDENGKGVFDMKMAVAVDDGVSGEKIIFHGSQIEQILSSETPGVQVTMKDSSQCLQLGDKVIQILNPNTFKSFQFYVLLKSQFAFGVSDFEFLFRSKILPDGYVSGIDLHGNEVKGKLFKESGHSGHEIPESEPACYTNEASVSVKELDSLKHLLRKLKKGEFYEALTEELSEKIKEIADEIVACRRDLQKKIEPNIIGLVTNEIPETSNELEGINETLEKSTMKIMDINDEVVALCAARLQEINLLCSHVCLEAEQLPGSPAKSLMRHSMLEALARHLSRDLDSLREIIQMHIETFEKIRKLSMNMSEPLCFQDLVGQRIQRIVRLVRSMEDRVQDLVVSLGVKTQKYKESPVMSYEEIARGLGSESFLLKGPQREGEGLNQDAVDDLLASL